MSNSINKLEIKIFFMFWSPFLNNFVQSHFQLARPCSLINERFHYLYISSSILHLILSLDGVLESICSAELLPEIESNS